MLFAEIAEVTRAYESRQIDLHAKISVRIKETQVGANGERTEKITR
jgi:DNA-directed RNA polymerase subunit beta'